MTSSARFRRMGAGASFAECLYSDIQIHDLVQKMSVWLQHWLRKWQRSVPRVRQVGWSKGLNTLTV